MIAEGPAFMSIRHALMGFTALISLSGCIGGGGKPPAYLFNLTPSQPRTADSGQAVAGLDIVAVNVPLVPRMLATSRIPVINGLMGVAYLKDAAWIDLPAPLFQRLLADTITASGGRVALLSRQASGIAGPRLGGELSMFGLDAATGETVIIYDAVLTGHADGKVRTRRFLYRAPASLSDPRQAARALETGANQVAAEVASWIAQN